MTVLYVSGQARCGSSLTMNMLATAGFPVVGTRPDFEVEDVALRAPTESFLKSIDGCAVKLLDPRKSPPPRDFPAYAIWLTRDPLEQAKSHAKFLAGMMGTRIYDRAGTRALAADLRRDERHHLAVLGHCALLTISFEDLVTGPLGEARRIADFVRPLGHDLDPAVMAAVVKPRSPKCRPDLSIEIEAAIAATVGTA